MPTRCIVDGDNAVVATLLARMPKGSAAAVKIRPSDNVILGELGMQMWLFSQVRLPLRREGCVKVVAATWNS